MVLVRFTYAAVPAASSVSGIGSVAGGWPSSASTTSVAGSSAGSSVAATGVAGMTGGVVSGTGGGSGAAAVSSGNGTALNSLERTPRNVGVRSASCYSDDRRLASDRSLANPVRSGRKQP